MVLSRQSEIILEGCRQALSIVHRFPTRETRMKTRSDAIIPRRMIAQQSEGCARTVRTQNYDAIEMFPVRLSEGILPGPPEKKKTAPGNFLLH